MVENDPKADPKAIISFDQSVPGGEEDGDDEEVMEAKADTEMSAIVPFIPKARD